VESDHATLKAIMSAVQSVQIRDLEDHQALGRTPVLEGPLDEGMADLRGAEPDREVGSGDGVEWFRRAPGLTTRDPADGPRWNRTISFEFITLDALPGRFRSIGGPARY